MADIELNETFDVAKCQMIFEEKHNNNSLLYVSCTDKQLKKRNFLKFAEEKIKLINRTRHATGIPIDFVLRLLLLPRVHADDPDTDYITPNDEACARACI